MEITCLFLLSFSRSVRPIKTSGVFTRDLYEPAEREAADMGFNSSGEIYYRVRFARTYYTRTDTRTHAPIRHAYTHMRRTAEEDAAILSSTRRRCRSCNNWYNSNPMCYFPLTPRVTNTHSVSGGTTSLRLAAVK